MISVCIAAYNGEKYIKAQLFSILQQLDKTDEIIVSDDGSTDKTVEIINSLKDSRIKIVHHNSDKAVLKNHFGKYTVVAKNFENALKYAKGDYIFMSDQDDMWDKNRVKDSINALKENLLVMCNFKIIDADDNLISNEPFYDKTPIFNSYVKNIIKCRFMCCCLAFKKELLAYVLPYPNNIESSEQWLGCIASKMGKVKFLKNTYHLYRRHGNNVSDTTQKSPNSLYYKLIFRFKLNSQIKKRIRLLKHSKKN